MKKLSLLLIIIISFSCSKEEDVPEIINDEVLNSGIIGSWIFESSTFLGNETQGEYNPLQYEKLIVTFDGSKVKSRTDYQDNIIHEWSQYYTLSENKIFTVTDITSMSVPIDGGEVKNMHNLFLIDDDTPPIVFLYINDVYNFSIKENKLILEWAWEDYKITLIFRRL